MSRPSEHTRRANGSSSDRPDAVHLALAILVLAAFAQACGGPGPVDPGGDAGPSLDAYVETDAFVLPPDSGEPDAGPTDEDGDGVPVPLDCDDTDVDVTNADTSPCANACGAGERTCSDGVWTDCDAPTECLCEVGQTRTIPCGRCGTQVETCVAANRWDHSTSTCTGETGECVPGETEMVRGERCSYDTRTCSESCTWSGFVETTPPGDCEAGQYTHCREGFAFVCPGDCVAVPGCTVCPTCV